MFYRIHELYGLSASLTTDVTIPIELDMADPISQLIIDARVKNGAGGASTEHPTASITKIEIVDGSDVLFSLDGFETEALDIYDSLNYPRGGWFNYVVGSPTDRQIAINFGRYLWDEVLAFDPTKFTNPKLNISFDVDAGGMTPASCQFSVLALMFDEKAITPAGFLMTKEVKKWTKAISGHEYTNCPLDYPYRKMLLQSRYAGIPPHWVFNNIKLASDQDKKVIFNGEYRDLMFGIGREGAYIRELLTGQGRLAMAYQHVTPTMDVMATANQWRQDCQDYSVATWDGDGGRLQIEATGNCQVSAHVQGWAPHGTLCIPFGKQDAIEDWFNVTEGIESLKLDVISGNASAVQKLFIQQYRTYP